MLLDSFRLGDLSLKNRVVMAPLTRARAGDKRPVADRSVWYSYGPEGYADFPHDQAERRMVR